MSSALKSFIFALVMCVVCSLLLTAASTGLKPLQVRNVAVDKQRNILRAVGFMDEANKYTPPEIEAAYSENIKDLRVSPSGEIAAAGQKNVGDLPIYLYTPDGEIDAYVIPIDTNGLWGRIHGYLAIEKDGSTVRGFAVYKHQETPGLGGEIESRWFRNNFQGKKIVNPVGKFVSISIAKGKVQDQVPEEAQSNYVDGISGATMTGRFLTEGLKDILADYEPVAVNLRNMQQDPQNPSNFLKF
jgi:Na+-transporting NADH:ubiquinone oxidoreductase subunit C